MWRLLKYFFISLLVLVILVCASIGIVLNFIFTPEKLTPIVEKSANEFLNAEVHFDAIELTFFSTFPEFGLEMRNGSVVTKVFQDSLKQENVYAATDSLMSFKRCRLIVNPMAYLSRKEVIVKELRLEEPQIYAYIDTNGVPGWNVMRESAEQDSVVMVETDTIQEKVIEGIDIRNIRIEGGKLVFDDRANKLYARLEGVGLKIDGNFMERKADLQLDVKAKNILFWQEGNLLVKRLRFGLQTGMRLDRDSMLYVLDKAVMRVNRMKFGVGGRLQADSLNHLLDVDLTFGIKVPSLKTLLDLVPETVLKHDENVTVSGEVLCRGTLKGKYGKDRVPVLDARFKINEGSVKYEGMPYSLDKLDVDLEGVVDLQKEQPSFLKLNRFYVKGTDVDVDLNGRGEQLLSNPLITASVKADVDFSILPQIFPIQEGVTLTGSLHAGLKGNVLLADIKNKNYGKLDIRGGCQLKNVLLASEKDSLKLRSKSVILGFGTNMEDKTILQEKNLLNGIFGFDSVDIQWKNALTFHMDTSYVKVKTSPLRDTTAVASMSADIRFGWIDLVMGDSLRFRMGNSAANFALAPSPEDKKIPLVKAKVKMDSLRVRARGNRLRLANAGFDLSGVPDRKNKRQWLVSGVVGFQDMRVYTPLFPLRMRMPGTKITLSPGHIKLNGAKLKMGRSDLLLTGEVYNLAGAFLRQEDLKANLKVRSNMMNCNQLMKAMEVGAANRMNMKWGTEEELSEDELSDVNLAADSTYVADSTMSVFVVPPGVDFTFETNKKKVLYGKLELDSIHGKVVMQNQCIELSDLSMRSMAADVKTTMLYKASGKEKAYTGFDLRMDDIDVGALINFMPSLDSIVPMLRSFDGLVNFHMAAETELDSTMMVDLPTLRAVAYIDGKDLVLMDGETFSEISKMLMFKNKERNLIDSVAVDFRIKDGMIEVFPFLVEVDRYKVAVGGEHKIDMTFNYHISVLKSPVPFKLGVDIYGSMEKMKFKITKAKYKNLFIPSKRAKVDSAQINVRNQIRQMLQAAKK